jgi:hypothetical protein
MQIFTRRHEVTELEMCAVENLPFESVALRRETGVLCDGKASVSWCLRVRHHVVLRLRGE